MPFDNAGKSMLKGFGHGQQVDSQVPKHVCIGYGMLVVRPRLATREQLFTAEIPQETRCLRSQYQSGKSRI